MPVQLIYDTTCVSTAGVCCAWTVPLGVSSVVFEIWGGGGGGGGGISSCDCCNVTMGGGGGGYSMKTVSTIAGCVYTICAANGAVDSTGTFGAGIGYCCNGCDGGTSFVTGYNVPANFCATGGKGACSNFALNCYGFCGCTGGLAGSADRASGGLGYNGDLNLGGMPGVIFTDGASTAMAIVTMGGNAGGPGGGAGGILGSMTCCYSCADNGTNGAYNMNGAIPGGGGSGHRNGTTNPGTSCTCTTTQSGKGGPGLVRITW